MPRAIKNLDISLGLATIPVQLFTAISSQGVAFHLLHAKCGSRIQMRLECPIHGIVPREETVKGYEVNKDEYVSRSAPVTGTHSSTFYSSPLPSLAIIAAMP
jgi:DNA end-binding protein Ku